MGTHHHFISMKRSLIADARLGYYNALSMFVIIEPCPYVSLPSGMQQKTNYVFSPVLLNLNQLDVSLTEASFT